MDDFPKIPDAVILIVPEAIARESCILPFEVIGDVLSLYYPADLDSIALLEDRLRFNFDRPVRLVPLERSKIREQIEVHYSRSYPMNSYRRLKTASPGSSMNALGNGIPSRGRKSNPCGIVPSATNWFTSITVGLSCRRCAANVACSSMALMCLETSIAVSAVRRAPHSGERMSSCYARLIRRCPARFVLSHGW
jgi:hypothetical protein